MCVADPTFVAHSMLVAFKHKLRAIGMSAKECSVPETPGIPTFKRFRYEAPAWILFGIDPSYLADLRVRKVSIRFHVIPSSDYLVIFNHMN